jgi:2-oxoglutarate dehydrogenase E1 component
VMLDALDERSIDWASGEELAFASILGEGIAIRVTGEDVERGTFSHRHAVFHDVKTGRKHIPLQTIPQARAAFEIRNSPLSENATVGFEVGYNVQEPRRLVLWEGQYGDFVNGAQVIIDEFITSGRAKWGLTPSLVLLLPHGYEGQGPEHSSARLERFLQACAEDNIQVCNLTTSAQYFHVLRRQMKRDFIKPLIIMTPKSLLRAEQASSRAEDFTKGSFAEILPAPEVAPAEKMERVIFCSGKVYYDLLNHRETEKISNAGIVRLEQLYPLAEEKLREILQPFSRVEKFVWCQEESQNMGAWSYIEPRLRALLGREILYAGRNASASPAVGALAVHKREQACVIAEAFGV